MDDSLYSVMDATSGIPLNDYLLNGQRPFGEEECARRMEPLIRALGNAQDRGERGLSVYPDDLLVRPDGMVAWRRPADDHTQGANARGKIRPGFSPIELYSEKSTTGAWTDVYTMCATLLYCMTGRIPPSPIDRLSGERLDLSGISPAAAAVLEKGLEIKYDNRIQSLRGLADRLYETGKTEGTSVTERTYGAAPRVLVEGQTERPQFHGAAVQTETSVMETTFPSYDTPKKQGHTDVPLIKKKRSLWKILIPMGVLAVVVVALVFAFRANWRDITVRQPGSEHTEASSSLDIKQLIPAFNSTGNPSPEPTITYAETKPYFPEYVPPSPPSFLMTGTGQSGLPGTTSAPGSQGTGTQTSAAGGTVSAPGSQGTGTQTSAAGGTVSAPGSQGTGTQTSAAGGTVSAPGNQGTGTHSAGSGAVNQNDANGITQPATTADGLRELTGQYGDVEGIRGPANPYYLDPPVTNCNHVRMDLSIEQISGSGFGYFYLYVMDPNGKWHHVALFRIEKEQADGKTVTYELDLDGLESFVAIAICPEEKGMDFTRRYNFKFYVDPDCISEYGDRIKRPTFTPAKSDHPISSVHVEMPAYSNPYGNASGGGEYYPKDNYADDAGEWGMEP